MTTLTDSTVLVTGANRGMGAEYVRQLLDRGVARVWAGARDPRTVTVCDPRVRAVALDVTDPASVAGVVARTGDIDVLVNNAGLARGESVLSPDTSALRAELETNLFGPLALVSAYADRLASRSGVVVNVASVLSWIALGGSYGVSKAALASATDSMRLELAPRGVQVVGVYVGYVDTDMAATVQAPKVAPGDVVRQVLDAVEAGRSEVLADDTARLVRSQLHEPIDVQLERLAAARA
jgi:NAD(P)-dependent dehydrogenase (short-subunit alcohol dehydrogenase family)